MGIRDMFHGRRDEPREAQRTGQDPDSRNDTSRVAYDPYDDDTLDLGQPVVRDPEITDDLQDRFDS